MRNWHSALITPEITILETMEKINNSSMQFAVVADENRKLLGLVTDGDIRRAILKGFPLNSNIVNAMNINPKYGVQGMSTESYKQIMEKHGLRQLPILDEYNRIYDIFSVDDFHEPQHSLKSNIVVLMAGGLGTRLWPLTEHIPKPMLKVGDKPILETIIEGFKEVGFVNFIISVNYKKDIIENYFQDGSHFGVNITYIEENKRMGTAGALSLLKEKPKDSFFVMNADLLTKTNYRQLLEFHRENESLATLCVREYEYQIPYGVITTDEHRLVSIQEKPVQKSYVNAGIYVLNPEILSYVPQNEFYDMPELLEKAILLNNQISVFPLREYWLDIGRIEDYDRANIDLKGGLYD